MRPEGPAPARGTGFLDRVCTAGGQAHRFQVYVPPGYDPERAWPVILFLHGAGERGADGRRQSTVGLGPAILRDPGRFPALAVFPQAPAGSLWVGVAAELALAALEQVRGEFRTDPDRISLSGLSMGGHGAWYLAYRQPRLFAAIAPICGWVEVPPGHLEPDPVVPPPDGPALAALALRLQGLPIWVFHGTQDATIQVAASREPVAALGGNRPPPRFTEYPSLGHNAWDAAYASAKFVSWLLAQRRSRGAR